MPDTLSAQEREILLKLARESIAAAVQSMHPPYVEVKAYSPGLQRNGASFVTLTEKSTGALRGCIGILEAYQPLVLDVQEHAIAAALEDYRFPPVQFSELPELCIEISRLTPPAPLEYEKPQDLLSRIRPHVDGLIIKYGVHRATFLPQVWEKLPDPEEFLTQLCYKMGMPGDTWRERPVQVFTYQVEEFHE